MTSRSPAVVSQPAPGNYFGDDRLGWIDVLRGIASLAVAVFHSMPALWVGMYHPLAVHFSKFDRIVAFASIPAHFGYAGVMLFFLLSGFVIHLPNASGSQFEYRSYLARRFWRIYPPYAMALALSVAVWIAFPGAVVFHGSWALIAKAFFMLQNYPHGSVSGLAPLQMVRNFALWSLPVELELYLVYPIVLYALRRWGRRNISVAVIAVSVLATILDLLPRNHNGWLAAIAGFAPTFLHYWAVWCSGAWLAECLASGRVPRWSRIWSGVFFTAMVLSLAAREYLKLSPDIEDYLWATTFFCTLNWLLLNRSARYMLDNRFFSPMRFLGKISYSLYLIHLPVFFAIAGYVLANRGYKTTNFLVCLGATVVAIAAASIMYEVIEKPSVRVARVFDRTKSSHQLSAVGKSI